MNRLGRLSDIEWIIGLLMIFGFMLMCGAGSQGVILAAIPVGFALGWNYRQYLIDQVFYVVVPACLCAFLTAHKLQEDGIIRYEADMYGFIVFVEILGIAVVLSKKRKDIPPPKEKIQEVPEE